VQAAVAVELITAALRELAQTVGVMEPQMPQLVVLVPRIPALAAAVVVRQP
jgi:hypothetical protein